MTVFGHGNSLPIEVNNAEVLPGMDFAAAALICVERALPPLFALLTKSRARLSVNQAFTAIGFQTLSVSVISLDLTGIIAFDDICEWEAARRLRCGGSGNGPEWELRSHGKKIGVCPEKQRKGSVGHETYCYRHSWRRHAWVGGVGRVGRHA
jgi:hypothetical protein